jgi:hypothetical protein
MVLTPTDRNLVAAVAITAGLLRSKERLASSAYQRTILPAIGGRLEHIRGLGGSSVSAV